MEGQDQEMGRLAQQFTSIEQTTWSTLAAVKEASEPRIKLEEAKGFLKGLESALDELERYAMESAEEKQSLQGTLRGFRRRYNDIVNTIMKEDSLYPYGSEFPSLALRRTSDLIFGESTMGIQGPGQTVAGRDREVFSDEEAKYSDELDDKPSDVQEFDRGNALQRGLYIAGGALLLIFLGTFVFLRYFC